jgi:hypothetical protein
MPQTVFVKKFLVVKKLKFEAASSFGVNSSIVIGEIIRIPSPVRLIISITRHPAVWSSSPDNPPTKIPKRIDSGDVINAVVLSRHKNARRQSRRQAGYTGHYCNN